jgi:hypothetical protein
LGGGRKRRQIQGEGEKRQKDNEERKRGRGGYPFCHMVLAAFQFPVSELSIVVSLMIPIPKPMSARKETKIKLTILKFKIFKLINSNSKF